MKIPEEVKYIIDKLEAGDCEAYAVGGCVRDSLLGQDPSDWDICTSAVPERTIKLFDRHQIVETGIQHGTVTLILNSNPYEITTYRADGLYTDNRRPDNVRFVTSLEEDLARRDFTVNAMAYNPREGVRDFFNGRDDLKSGVIRCVGTADARFREDALRIMRALRFASALGFSIEANTAAAIHANKKLLHNVAVERIAAELNKLIVGEDAGAVMLDYEKVICEIIPEVRAMIGFEQRNPHHYLDVWRHTLSSVDKSPADVVLRLTMLLHDISKPRCYTDDGGTGHFYGHPKAGAKIAKSILTRLRYDSSTIAQVSELILYHDNKIRPERKHIKRWLNKIGEERFRQLIEVQGADLRAKAPYYRRQKIRSLNKVFKVMNEILDTGQCFSLKNLAVNGRDLIAAGIPKGVKVGIILNRLLEMVISESAENNKDTLLTLAKDMMAE